MTSVEIVFLGVYFGVLCVLSLYGSHRYRMAYLYYRHKFKLPTPRGLLQRLPRVTVQLPVFNEMYVVERLIGSVCRIDYPRELLEIQVLDDSTDETCSIARACVEKQRARGRDVVYVHREDRRGFKAGALENGLKTAKGEFVAVFDADFVPSPDFLKRTVPFFADPKVGMVQVSSVESSSTWISSSSGGYSMPHTASISRSATYISLYIGSWMVMRGSAFSVPFGVGSLYLWR